MLDRRLLILFATTTLITMLYGLITPFLPLLAKDHDLTEVEIGITFSFFPFVGLLISPFVGTFMFKIGRRNMLMIAFVNTALGFIVAAASTWTSRDLFFVLNIISRGLMGSAFSVMFTTGKG